MACRQYSVQVKVCEAREAELAYSILFHVHHSRLFSVIWKDVWNIQNSMHIIKLSLNISIVYHRFQGCLWHFLTPFYFRYLKMWKGSALGPTSGYRPRCTVLARLSLWRVRCKEMETRPMHSSQNTTRPPGKLRWKWQLQWKWYESY